MKLFSLQQEFQTHLWALRIGLTLAASSLAAAQFIHRADLHDFLTGMALGILLVAVVASFAIRVFTAKDAPNTPDHEGDLRNLDLG